MRSHPDSLAPATDYDYSNVLQTLLDPIDRTHHEDSSEEVALLDVVIPVAEEALAESQTPMQVLETLHEIFFSWSEHST